jgi:hypothetical protein
VHLQVAAKTLFPRGVGFENHSRICSRWKIAPNRWDTVNLGGWLFNPRLQLFRDERPYAVQFSKRAARFMHIAGPFGPKESAARGSPKRSNQNA